MNCWLGISLLVLGKIFARCSFYFVFRHSWRNKKALTSNDVIIQSNIIRDSNPSVPLISSIYLMSFIRRKHFLVFQAQTYTWFQTFGFMIVSVKVLSHLDKESIFGIPVKTHAWFQPFGSMIIVLPLLAKVLFSSFMKKHFYVRISLLDQTDEKGQKKRTLENFIIDSASCKVSWFMHALVIKWCKSRNLSRDWAKN